MLDRYITLLEQFPYWVVSDGGWVWVGLGLIVIAFWVFNRR